MSRMEVKSLLGGQSEAVGDAPAGVPLYERVRMRLKRAVLAHGAPGDLLPTQQEIAREMGASMITVKRALSELAREGLIESIRGKGTVVCRVEVTDLHAGVSSWTSAMRAAGETPQTAWTKIDRPKPSSQTLNLLRLPPSARVVRVRRLRMIQDQPICLITNQIPDQLVPNLSKEQLDSESLYECLSARYQLEPRHADEEVTARASTAQERRYLSDECKIVLVISRRTFLANGRPLEVATMIANADRYRYQVQLTNPVKTDECQADTWL